MRSIVFLLPEPWIDLIDKAKGDQPRTYWLRDVIRQGLKDQGIWPEKEDEHRIYVSLEQQIQKLWESRGLEVEEEKVSPLGEGRFIWTIIAKEKREDRR